MCLCGFSFVIFLKPIVATKQSDNTNRQRLVVIVVEFDIKTVTGNEAYLFNMISLALYGIAPFTNEVRRGVVSHVVTNYDHFGKFITDIKTGTKVSQQTNKT